MKKKKALIISGGILFTIVTLVLAIKFSSSASPPPDPALQSTDDQLHYLASKEFGTLSDKEKSKYVNALDRRNLFRESRSLPDAERKKLFENIRPIFRMRMRERIKSYAALKSPAEKQAYLDKIIDRIVSSRQKRRQKRQASTDKSGKNDSSKRRWRGPSLSRIKEHIESTDPAERAQFMEFIVDLRHRMEERGVASPFRRH